MHDHVRFDFHIPVKNDPYPHEFKEGYAYDGVDLGIRLAWHWGHSPLITRFRISPVARSHFAFDQDTDFKPGTNSTHGDAGIANSRTFAITQELPWWNLGRLGRISLNESFLSQPTQYGLVTTYDLNSNPALPSSQYQRVITEQANVYELRTTVTLTKALRLEHWELGNTAGTTPIAEIMLHNYVPLLAATSTEAYGFVDRAWIARRIGGIGVQLSGQAASYNSFHSIEGYRRQVFSVELDITPWQR